MSSMGWIKEPLKAIWCSGAVIIIVTIVIVIIIVISIYL